MANIAAIFVIKFLMILSLFKVEVNHYKNRTKYCKVNPSSKEVKSDIQYNSIVTKKGMF